MDYLEKINLNSVKTKILVVIANFGTKNTNHCERILQEFKSMSLYDCDICVLSNVPKSYGEDVDVLVGLPTKDPWSLPFGHKDIFYESRHLYDLFIYTEDDVLITEENINSFVEVTKILPEDRIAGFVRYEINSSGERYYPDMHSHFHWDSNSIEIHGNDSFAYHTNEHSACFILTRGQLRIAIESGGFMLPPRKDSYDMLVTAATDPYTKCGLKKIICLSKFMDFNIHHLSNAYLGKIGISAEYAKIEIDHLALLASNKYGFVKGPLFKYDVIKDRDRWNKKYYEYQRNEILRIVPLGARRVLSVGCGCGTTESVLVHLGTHVVGIPLDSIIGESARHKGVEVISPDFDISITELGSQKFESIIIADILQHLQDPSTIIRRYRDFLCERGLIILTVPNWSYIGYLRQRIILHWRRLINYHLNESEVGVHLTTSSLVSSWLLEGGFGQINHFWEGGERFELVRKYTFGGLDALLCKNIVIVAKRN